jgi:hypothetical protein
VSRGGWEFQHVLFLCPNPTLVPPAVVRCLLRAVAGLLLAAAGLVLVNS